MQEELYGVMIDKSRDSVFTDEAIALLRNFYMLPDEDSPQEAFARASQAYAFGDVEFAQRIYDYVSKQWFMFASPVLSNAPKPGLKPKALPISCFLLYVGDSLVSLIDHTSELRWLSVMGGGVGGHWSDVRSVSNVAPGPIPFIHTVDADMQAYKQGTTRKGSYAAYMDISHPDIEEFIQMRVPASGGDVNRKAFNIHNAVNISDEFMNAVLEGKEWNLKDPNDGTVRSTVDARKLWQEILTIRYRTGEPYLWFIDEANRRLPLSQRWINSQEPEANLKNHGSNLCSEISLVTNEERTAVCCLSSLNLEKYEEWKDTNIVQDLIRLLDNVIDVFIDNAPDSIARAKYSAMRERSIGLGTMGWHALLQSKMIPFESGEAFDLNNEIFGMIWERAVLESKRLGEVRGVYPDLLDVPQYIIDEQFPEDQKGRRNAHLIAIAPNASSSNIIGTSPSVEMWRSNAFINDNRSGVHINKNKYLEAHLESIGKNTDKVWNEIRVASGSVQGLKFLDDKVKAVFKTAMEVDQHAVIKQAGDRQKYVCQAQSINTFFPAKVDKAYLNSVHIAAWKEGLKSVYYLRTEKGDKIEKMVAVERVALQEENKPEDDVCVACEA